MPKITYACENHVQKTLEVSAKTILDVSLAHDIPHYHACNGHARCTTCRVIILKGLEQLTPRTRAEHKLAQERNWPDYIRLACQTGFHGDIQVRRLVIDPTDADLIASETQFTSVGHEQSLVVMFCDIVDFTAFSAKHFPYDVVHLLNRYYQAVCKPILTYQGYIDKYMGDGLMALFGLHEATPQQACLNAIRASLQMHDQVQALNQCVLKNFAHEFAIRIGLHYGLVIVGEIGHASKRQLTVLGDTVNIASRIEAVNKELGTQLLISQELLDYVPQQVIIGRHNTRQLRGQTRLHTLYEIIGVKQSS